MRRSVYASVSARVDARASATSEEQEGFCGMVETFRHDLSISGRDEKFSTIPTLQAGAKSFLPQPKSGGGARGAVPRLIF